MMIVTEHPMRMLLFLSLFYCCGSQGTEGLNNFPMVIQLTGDRARIYTQRVSLKSSVLYCF